MPVSHVVVVVQDAEGTRHERVVLQPHQPILIGRGWHCDIIVQDQQVDPEHARLLLSPTDEMLCEDLGSRNGTKVDGKSIDDAQAMGSGGAVKLGRATLRVYRSDHQVGPAVHPSRWEAVRNQLEQPRWALASLLLLLASSAYTLWGSTTSELQADALVNAGASALGNVGVWVIFWGVISKLLRNSMHLYAHVSIAATFWLLAFFVDRLAGFFGWQTLSVEVESAITALGSALLLFVAGVLTLGVATRLRRSRLLLLGALPSLLLLASVYVLPLLRESQPDRYPKLVTNAYPPSWRVGSGVELEAFVAASPSLYERSGERAHERAEELAQERIDKLATAEKTAREAE